MLKLPVPLLLRSISGVWLAGPKLFHARPNIEDGGGKGGLVSQWTNDHRMSCPEHYSYFYLRRSQPSCFSTFPNSRLEVEVQTLSVPPLVLSYWRPPHLRLHMAQHLGKTPAAKMYTHVDATETRLIKAMARDVIMLYVEIVCQTRVL